MDPSGPSASHGDKLDIWSVCHQQGNRCLSIHLCHPQLLPGILKQILSQPLGKVGPTIFFAYIESLCELTHECNDMSSLAE